MVELEEDIRPFMDIWNDYLAPMAQAAWAETSTKPMNFDFATATSIDQCHCGGVWAIVVDGERKGYIGWVKNNNMFTSEPIVTVVSLYLAPDARSRKNLLQLMRELKAKVKPLAKYYVISDNKQNALCDRVWIREV